MAVRGSVPYAGAEARPDQLDRWLALGGLVGPVLFVLTFTVAGLLRPGYAPAYQAVSDLGVGEHAWLLNGSLVALGLLLIGFAAAFYRTVRPEANTALRAACAFFLAVAGVGYVAAGVFPETTPLHWLVGATCAFLGAPLAFLLAGLLLRGDPAWRGWGSYSLVACAATVLVT